MGSPGEDVEMGWLQEVGCVDGWSMSIVLAMGDDARSTAAWPKLTRL